MKRRDVLRNPKGFSLTELMIVVAIIGILATLAIPKFLQYQAKAKQTEAKANLVALHTSEIAYFAENNNLTNNTPNEQVSHT